MGVRLAVLFVTVQQVKLEIQSTPVTFFVLFFFYSILIVTGASGSNSLMCESIYEKNIPVDKCIMSS